MPVEDFAEHVFGVCLVNDWSARDLQAWEYVPLGPFLGKSLRHLVSPWVVPLGGAGRPPGSPPPPRGRRPLPYLDDAEPTVGPGPRPEVALNGELVSCPPFASMYWTPAQQLAHLTVNGAASRTGDLFASGTVSGPEQRPARRLHRAELERPGAAHARGREQRSFLEDGDEVVITATAPGRPAPIALGEVRGRVLPAG